MRDVKVAVRGQNAISKTFKDIGSDAERMGKAVEGSAQRSARSMEDLQKKATAVGAGIGTLVGIASASGQAFQAESLQIRALERAYGDQAGAMDALAQKYQQMGIASDDAVRIAELGAQSLVKNYALTTDEITKLIERSADLSQTTFDQFGNQLGLADVMQRVTAAIRGEAESAEILGVAMNDQRLAALAAAEGMTGWNTTMTDAEKAAFRLKIFLQDTASAQGAAEERSETLAGQMNALKLRVLDSASAFGEFLGPVGESTAVLGDLALAAPLAGAAVGKLSAAVTALTGGGAVAGGLAGLTAAAVPLAAAMAAFAAPVGIATYLFLDQSNVMKRATEETLKNKEALQGYIDYLNSLQLPTAQVQEMSDEMKVLVDWVTKVGDTIETGIIQAAPNLKPFVTNVGELDDTIRGLEPENLEAVLRLAEQLGIVFGDPSTWNQEAINTLSNYIIALSQAEADADYEAVELARAQRNLNAELAAGHTVLELTAEQTAETSIEMVRAAGGIELVADNFGKAVEAAEEFDAALGETHGNITQLVRSAKEGAGVGLGNMFGGVDDLGAIGLGITDIDERLSALADTLKTDFAGAASAAYNRVVGFTGGMVSSIDKSKSWANALIAPVGVYSELDNMLARGEISLKEYNEAQQAQIDITNDSARATTAANVIQAMQAETVADGTKATADYLEKISKMNEEEQALALAWADTDIAERANDIADMAGEFGDMNTAQKKAFESMVESAAATDPALAAVLSNLGLIKQDANGDYQLVIDGTDTAESTLGDVVDVLEDIATIMEQQFLLDAKADLDATAFWTAYYALPSSKDLTLYIHQVTTPGDDYGGHAHGGAVRFATGGVARLAELGPELLRYPSGAMGLAMTDGLYTIPNGTQVDTANATKEKVRPERAGITITGPVYVYPPTADLHAAISSAVLNGGL